MERLIAVLQSVEFFAAKIEALLSRAAAGGLYDTYNMINLGLFSKDEHEMLRKSVIFYMAVSQEKIPERYDVNVIDRISWHCGRYRNIKREYLSDKNRRLWIFLIRQGKKWSSGSDLSELDGIVDI